jgi:hypothetical protein
MTISTVPVSTSIPVRDIGREEITGDDERHTLRVRHVGEPDETDVETSFSLTPPQEGVDPYYVRVRQYDGETAWSSPVYITRA